MKKDFRSKQKKINDIPGKAKIIARQRERDSKNENREWEKKLLQFIHKGTSDKQIDDLVSFIQSLLQDAEKKPLQSKTQVKAILFQGYEAGVRDIVEGIIDDLMKGLEAMEGDMKDSPKEKHEYYLGYQRALRVSIEHTKHLAVAMGVYLVANNLL